MVITSPHGRILRLKKGESLRSLAKRQHEEFVRKNVIRVRKKLTKEERKKIIRVRRSRKKVAKAHKRLEIAVFRRKQAEKGHVIKALFGKPKKIIRVRRMK